MSRSDLERVEEKFLDDEATDRLGGGFDGRAWSRPPVGFSGGDDSLCKKFKEMVDPSQWTPPEAVSIETGRRKELCRDYAHRNLGVPGG